MKISTKTGDRGMTSLVCGRRVKKDNLRIEVCGTLDELSSFLGLCKNLLRNETTKRSITKIQRDLFVIGSEIACHRKTAHRLKKKIKQGNVRGLELFIEKLEKGYKARGFVLPGRSTSSAILDVARTVARRAERRIVTLKKKGIPINKYILIYLNRLSDLLFLLARKAR